MSYRWKVEGAEEFFGARYSDGIVLIRAVIRQRSFRIHVRRTDKVLQEAAHHSIEEYMVHVEEFYQKLSLKSPVETRRVYVATDEPRVIEELSTR